MNSLEFPMQNVKMKYELKLVYGLDFLLQMKKKIKEIGLGEIFIAT